LENIADSDLMDALSQISDIADRNSTIRFLKDVASRYALNTIAYFGVSVTGQNETDPYLAVTYPPEWVAHYKNRQYVDVDPVVRLGFRRMLPLDWDEFGKPTGRLKTFFGEAGEFGIGSRGLTVPVHGRRGDRALFSVTSDLSARDWASAKLLYMRDFQVLATHIHDRVLGVVRRPLEYRRPVFGLGDDWINSNVVFLDVVLLPFPGIVRYSKALLPTEMQVSEIVEACALGKIPQGPPCCPLLKRQ